MSSLRPLGARSISISVTKPYLYFSPSGATLFPCFADCGHVIAYAASRGRCARRVSRANASSASTSTPMEFQPKLTRSADRGQIVRHAHRLQHMRWRHLAGRAGRTRTDHHPVEIQRDERGFRSRCPGWQNSTCWLSACAISSEHDGGGQQLLADRDLKRSRSSLRGARRRRHRAAAFAAAPNPAMPATFSVPARRPRSCPPPCICGRERRTFLHDQRARRPAARRACAPKHSDNRRRARQIQRDLAGRLTASTSSNASRSRTSFETSRKRLNDARLVVGRHHGDQRAALAFAQHASRKASRSTAPSAVAGISTCAKPGDALGNRGQRVARTESCSIADTKSRVDRRAGFQRRHRQRPTAPAHWLPCRRW